MGNSPDTSKKEFVLSNISWPLNKTRDALTTSSFDNIPNEIILQIFRYLSVHDLCNVSLVCRLFKMIADHDEIWKSKANKPIKLYSKSYKQIYIEWIHIKKIQYEDFTFSNCSSMRRNAYGFELHPSFPIRSEGKHNFVCIHGFDQHPNSTQEMTINLSVDIDKMVRQLISLWGKASYSQQKWQHSHILKQMIQRYYRFMQLKAYHSPNLFLIPTLDIEIVWQTHLLRPEIYDNDCLRLFHRVIDHSFIINHIQQYYKEQAFFGYMSII
ncbi:unnamed protein product [Rotaria sordida]|uniref:F-box domain-containing protein n=1 Tax=Rotaria sordida TaxID=392033 RepID=A0A819IAH6_9BILA|nr:unnamed protein product [Rotaria sordida]